MTNQEAQDKGSMRPYIPDTEAELLEGFKCPLLLPAAGFYRRWLPWQLARHNSC